MKKVVGENGWFVVDADFAKVRFVKAELQTYRGTVTARVKWKPGVFTDECGSQTKVLVVESRVGGHPIWLYVTCPDSAFEDEAEMQRLAILARVVSAAKQPQCRRFSCFGRRPGRLERKVSTNFGPVRKYFSPSVFRGLVKIRDKLSLKILDKRVGFFGTFVLRRFMVQYALEMTPLFIPKDRKSLFRQFLAGMYDAVVITDPNGHILEINARAVEYFGREIDEVLDRPVSVFVPALKPEVVLRVRRGIEEGRHVVLDVNAVTRTGEKIACEVVVSSIDLMNPGDLVFTLRNVERRREFMNAFKAKSNAFDISQTALFGCDLEGNLRDCNETFLQMFGQKDIEEARRHVFSDFMDDAPLSEAFRKALAGEKTVTSVVAEGDDGDQEELEIILAPNMHRHRNHGVVGSILKIR